MGDFLSLTLHLGVVEMPYDNGRSMTTQDIFNQLRKGKPPSRSAVRGTVTTGDVAGFLEGKYHVMEVFFELYKDAIAEALKGSLAGSLENLLMGGPEGAPAFGTASGEIETLFRKFLESKEMDSLGIPGVPTQASLDGVSPRFKRGKGPVRPSFVASGLYENNFTAWVD